MRPIAIPLLLAIGLSGAADAAAQAAHTHPPSPAAAPQVDVPAAARPAVAVVERFSKALAAADFKTVESLLEADVLILESGGAERSRQEYLAHHAIGDARFLKDAHSQLQRRRARVSGELAWVGSERELHASKDGTPLTLLSTETMVLRKAGGQWRIVHIHWSSRPQKTK